MGILSATVAAVAAIVGAFALQTASRVVAEEIKDWLPFISEKLLTIAVNRLPRGERERYRKEWTADLYESPGKLSKVLRACGFCLASLQIGSIISSKTGDLAAMKVRLAARLKFIFRVPALRRVFMVEVAFQTCFLAPGIWAVIHFHWGLVFSVPYSVANWAASYFFGKWLIRRNAFRALRQMYAAKPA
jgi:hypothetical protein